MTRVKDPSHSWQSNSVLVANSKIETRQPSSRRHKLERSEDNNCKSRQNHIILQVAIIPIHTMIFKRRPVSRSVLLFGSLVLMDRFSVSQAVPTRPWLQEHFPNPDTNARTCRSARICDPDSVLSLSEIERLEAFLEEKRYIETSDDCLQAPGPGEASDQPQGLDLQMGVAIVKKVS